MTRIAIDATTGDLYFDRGRVATVTGAQATAERIRARFRFGRGEWFMDRRLGLPWFEEILGKHADLSRPAQVFRLALATTPGVAAIDEFSMVADHATRVAEIRFRVRLDSGGVLNSRDFPPFIVEI